MARLLSEIIKEHTKSSHRQLEKVMVKQLRAIQTNEDYIKLLQLFYSYFGALEDEIGQYLKADQFREDFQRRKASRLIEDIKALGGRPEKKAKQADLPVIENRLQAFGALYVIEGSTLGGQVIVKMLERQMTTNRKSGFTFFNGYGEETAKRWTSFKNLLDEQVRDETEARQILEAADVTFEKFKVMFEKHYRD